MCLLTFEELMNAPTQVSLRLNTRIAATHFIVGASSGVVKEGRRSLFTDPAVVLQNFSSLFVFPGFTDAHGLPSLPQNLLKTSRTSGSSTTGRS
jgi:hypothetical protein